MNAEIEDLKQKIIDLEIRSAYLEDYVQALQEANLYLQDNLKLQQEQLRYLFQQLQEQSASKINEKPPHY